MKLRIRLAAAFVAATTVSSPSLSAAEELIGVIVGPLETARGQGFQHFAERFPEISNGEMTVKIYPDGQLGHNNELFQVGWALSQLRTACVC